MRTPAEFSFRAADHVVAVACVLVLSLVVYFTYNCFFHPLSRLPGPWHAHLGIPWFRTWATVTRSYGWAQHRMHEKYGPTVRLGPNFVSTIDPEVVHALYAHGSQFHKSQFYMSFASIKTAPSLFSDIDHERHGARRKSVAHVYSMKKLVDLEAFIDSTIDHLLERISREIGDTHSSSEYGGHGTANILLNECMSFFAADAVGELAFGENFGFLSNGDPASMLPAARNLATFGSIAGVLPRLSDIIRAVLWRTSSLSPIVIAHQAIKRVDDRFRAIEASNFYDENGQPGRRDMLTGFIESKDARTKEPLSRRDVLSQATAVFGAGSDTTAVALDAFFYFVLRDRDVYARVQSELDEAVESGVVSFPITYAQGTKLEYLQACMKEAMRLMPSVSMEMPRHVIPGGMMASGHFIPAGTVIGASAFSFHRSTEAYGEDAHLFRPERWLDIPAEKRAALERNNLVFGAGARVCIGKNISLMEMTKVIPSMLWKYDFSFSPRTSDGPHSKRSGRGLDGVETAEEPFWLDSSWFLEVSDFWCVARSRAR